jgi:hypothetical protein
MAGLTSITQTQLATQVQITSVEGDVLSYTWDTMPGNLPQSNQNKVFLWQTDVQAVPTGTTPKDSHTPGTDQEDGSDNFTDVTITNDAYLLAYAVGPDVKNICATVLVPSIASGGQPNYEGPSISIINVGTTSLLLQYVLPEGVVPQADGDWVGIWIGQSEAVLYGVAPAQFVPVQSGQHKDNVSLNIAIERGNEYTIGYFKGGYDATKPVQKALACSTTYNN